MIPSSALDYLSQPSPPDRVPPAGLFTRSNGFWRGVRTWPYLREVEDRNLPALGAASPLFQPHLTKFAPVNSPPGEAAQNIVDINAELVHKDLGLASRVVQPKPLLTTDVKEKRL